MAQVSDFQINGRIEWRAKVPRSNTPCSFDSPTFRLLGSEWYLQFTYFAQQATGAYNSFGAQLLMYSYHDLVVYLIPKTSEGEQETLLQSRTFQTLQTPFSVATFVRHPTDPSQTPVAWKWCEIAERKNVDIWKACYFPGDVLNYIKSLCQGGELRIVCLFYSADPSPNGDSVLQDFESLSSDFSKLLEKGNLSDVSLVCKGRTFRAHKSVLVARSRLFRVMLQDESRTGAVQIPDMDAAVLERLLKYLYAGETKDLPEGTAADLYEAADKYAIDSLKTSCTRWIVRNLTVKNCLRYLVIAYFSSDNDLGSAVVTFITKNPSVLKSDAWLALSIEFPGLANEVFQTYVASTVQ